MATTETLVQPLDVKFTERMSSLEKRMQRLSETWDKLINHELEGAKVKENIGFKIVILDKGFVYVGDIHVDGAHRWAYIDEAWNVRYWGTTRGLGQLRKGPTSKTEIDPVGKIQVPFETVMQIIDTDKEKWIPKFATVLDDIAKEGI